MEHVLKISAGELNVKYHNFNKNAKIFTYIYLCKRTKVFNQKYFFVDFNWKRCAFRTLTVFFLLFIAESIPSFGAILQLIGASTVTLLTFIFPPLFYMRLVDASTNNKEWIQRFVINRQVRRCKRNFVHLLLFQAFL